MQPIVVLYLLWVLWFLTWLAVAIVGDPGPHKVRGPFLLVYRLAIVGAMLLLFTITPWPGLDVQYRFWDGVLSDEAEWGLTAAAATGFLLAWWATVARLIAGRRANGVVDRGPYKLVRHPTYLGLVIAAVATAVLFGRPSSSAGAGLFIAVFLTKILIDERALREDEPAYEDYAERVSMLLPIPKRRPERNAPARHAPAPFSSLRQAEPTAVQAEPELAATVSESAPELPVKPVQLKLSLDLGEKGEPAALTGADLKP